MKRLASETPLFAESSDGERKRLLSALAEAKQRVMNLLWRLLWLTLWARRRPACPLLGPCMTSFRVMPSDLDVLRHMNNGKYFSLLDLGRVDLMMRSGLASKLENSGFYPVVAAESMQFRASLQLFEAFDIETRVVGWDEKVFLLDQRFVRRGKVIASGWIWARMLRKAGGSVSPREVLGLAGYEGPALPLPAWARDWNTERTAA